MNYHQARQTADKSGWDWTTMNDGQIWRSGACADHGPGGHGTREEAERHFYDGEIARLREQTWTSANRCEAPHDGEPPWTDKTLGTNLLHEAFLCDEHRTAEGFREARPFEPGMSITASW